MEKETGAPNQNILSWEAEDVHQFLAAFQKYILFYIYGEEKEFCLKIQSVVSDKSSQEITEQMHFIFANYRTNVPHHGKQGMEGLIYRRVEEIVIGLEENSHDSIWHPSDLRRLFGKLKSYLGGYTSKENSLYKKLQIWGLSISQTKAKCDTLFEIYSQEKVTRLACIDRNVAFDESDQGKNFRYHELFKLFNEICTFNFNPVVAKSEKEWDSLNIKVLAKILYSTLKRDDDPTDYFLNQCKVLLEGFSMSSIVRQIKVCEKEYSEYKIQKIKQPGWIKALSTSKMPSKVFGGEWYGKTDTKKAVILNNILALSPSVESEIISQDAVSSPDTFEFPLKETLNDDKVDDRNVNKEGSTLENAFNVASSELEDEERFELDNSVQLKKICPIRYELVRIQGERISRKRKIINEKLEKLRETQNLIMEKKKKFNANFFASKPYLYY